MMSSGSEFILTFSKIGGNFVRMKRLGFRKMDLEDWRKRFITYCFTEKRFSRNDSNLLMINRLKGTTSFNTTSIRTRIETLKAI